MRTTEEIYNALCAAFASESGAAVAEGGDMSLRLKAVAAEIFSLEAQADFVSRQSFPQTAAGDYLDRHAELRGLQRKPAQKAAGSLRFYLDAPTSGNIAVPAGTECMTAAGLTFVTAEAAVISAGSTFCTVPAEAAAAGNAGNVPIGAVNIIRLPPSGVSGVLNDTAFSGGTERENDEGLRARVLSSYRSLPNGANVAYYENKVLSVPGTAAVTVLPRNRGTGTVDVVFSTAAGVPDASEITAVQTLLDSEREICVDIQVLAPTAAAVNITAELSVADGYEFEDVQAAAQSALSEYFSGELLGKAVYRAKLNALLMAVEGVENCVLTAPAADLTAAVGTLPVLGTVSFSEAQ